jgi:hypothetical protein
MAKPVKKRDPNKTARNKSIKQIKEDLEEMLPKVLSETGIASQQSLNAMIGGKAATFIDLKDEVITSQEQYISLYLQGFEKAMQVDGWTAGGASFSSTTLQENYATLKSSPAAQEYFMLFLKRSFLKHYDELARKRPTVGDAEIWIGQNNSDYGILVSPRYRDGGWENDKSEIRHFPELYWTIGHVLRTGLVVQDDDKPMRFDDVEAYLDFFRKVLVRPSGSKYEREIAAHYCDYVLSQEDPRKVPLLIPEFRYRGKEKAHKYRLDFCIINPITLDKVGVELSPWSTHGKLTGTKNKTQKEINEEALANFEKEMDKHRAYFQKHDVFTLIYTDKHLADTSKIFDEMSEYLHLTQEIKQLEFHLMNSFFL